MPTKTTPDNDELRKITGIGADEESAMDREAHNGAAEDIAEKNDLDNRAGDEIPFNTEANGRVYITKKQGIIGGIIGLLVGGGIGNTHYYPGTSPVSAILKYATGFSFLK